MRSKKIQRPQVLEWSAAVLVQGLVYKPVLSSQWSWQTSLILDPAKSWDSCPQVQLREVRLFCKAPEQVAQCLALRLQSDPPTRPSPSPELMNKGHGISGAAWMYLRHLDFIELGKKPEKWTKGPFWFCRVLEPKHKNGIWLFWELPLIGAVWALFSGYSA